LPEPTASDEPTAEKTGAGISGGPEFGEKGGTPPEGGLQLPVIIGAAVGGLVLMATLLVVVLLFCKKKKTSSSVEVRSTISESVMPYETRLIMETELVEVTQDNPLGSLDTGAQTQTFLGSPLD
jgi:hypothetical protein